MSISRIRSAVFWTVLLSTTVLLSAAVAAAPAPTVPPTRAVAAERATLERVVEEGAVHTAAPTPGVTLYIQDLVSTLFSRFLGFLESFVAAEVARQVTVIGAYVVFAGALVLLGYAAWRLFSTLRGPPGERKVRTVALAEKAELAGRSRAEWRQLLEARLATGDVDGACEALWWWLARGLTAGPVEASWTSRELLDHTGRRDLAPGVRQLDRLIYGAVRPAVEDVRGVWAELRRAVRDTVGEGAVRPENTGAAV